MSRILHLVGSPTGEFFADLSRLYARAALDALRSPHHEHVVAHVEPGGAWRFPTTLDRLDDAPAMPVADAVAHLASTGPDVAVPQMFCRPGMTSYRGLLDVLGIPYVGNTPDVMAIGADKARASAIVAAAGVDVPPAELLRPGERPSRVGAPAVVKPADADNSHGVTFVRSPDEWDAALAAAFEHSARAIVEEFVPLGREVRAGVLERDDELVALPLEEYRLDAETRPIRVPGDKLRRDDDGALGLVAHGDPGVGIVDTDDPLTARVGEIAKRCHVALGCRDYSLFDFRVDPSGRPWFLEAGLYCSFAPSSVVVVMARAAGIELADLFGGCAARAQLRGS